MRILIGGLLITVGFISGVVYDQNMAVLALQKQLRAEQVRNEILRDAIAHMRPNKFKALDYIYDAMKRYERRL